MVDSRPRQSGARGESAGARRDTAAGERPAGPWFRCYPDSALGDLAGLSPEQRNIAFTLALMQASRGGRVRLMPKTLAIACGTTTRPFKRVLGELQGLGLAVVEGEWITIAMRGFGGATVAGSGQLSAKFGASFGEDSAKFGVLPAGFPNDSSRARARQQPESRVESQAAAAAFDSGSIGLPGGQAGDNPDGRAGGNALTLEAEKLHRRVCAALGLATGYRDELGVARGWLSAGHAPETVMAAVARVVARKRFQPPLSLTYFTPVIEEAAAGPAPSPAPEPATPKPPMPEPEGPPEWLALRAALKRFAGEAVFASWFAGLDWLGAEAGIARLGARSQFIARHIGQHHSSTLERAAGAAGLSAATVSRGTVLKRRARDQLGPGEDSVIRTAGNTEGRQAMSSPSARDPPE